MLSSSAVEKLRDPAFISCLRGAIVTPGLVEAYDRLRGTNLARRGTPLELAIDATTGRLEDDLGGFVDFVLDAVYSRLPAEVLSELRLPT